jgi:hypothetical protein
MQGNKSLESDVKSLFIDLFNRPKKKPIHETAVQIAMEEKYDHKKTSYALRQLETQKIISSIKLKVGNVGNVKFFLPKKINEIKSQSGIRKKILRYSYWIERYSDYKITRMLGDHLHALVKGELRAQGFMILSEFSNEYNNKKWEGKETLDIIAENRIKRLVVGVEVKNMLSLISHKEVSTKIKMCNFLGIKPIFACRWIEPHRKKITENGGLAWQFKKQLYPLGQENFVKEIRKRFNFPMEVKSELPAKSILEFREWIEII